MVDVIYMRMVLVVLFIPLILTHSTEETPHDGAEKTVPSIGGEHLLMREVVSEHARLYQHHPEEYAVEHCESEVVGQGNKIQTQSGGDDDKRAIQRVVGISTLEEALGRNYRTELFVRCRHW